MAGWLQIERRIPVTQKEQISSWTFYHPHYRRSTSYSHDSLYLAADRLTLPGLQIDMPGAGVFPHYHPALCLTNQAPYLSRSMWRLPAWMHPGHETIPLSYHTDLSRWTSREDHALLRSAGRGQEFVLDCDEYPEAQKWLAGVIGLREHDIW
ncbi:MAG TPA: hypothetical protein VKR83_03545 [Ktedonobacteraceae bacterium]|nr:hypothetical protein [Ktedonobacteraceae bacterium]